MAERPKPTHLEPDGSLVKDRQFVTALARGLELLRCYSPDERYLGITELSRRTGLPKPTVSRLAGTLTKLGYMNFVSDIGKYQLGPGVLSLGYSFLSNVDVRQFARPKMSELAEASQAACSLAIRDRLSMVYVETVRSSASIAIQLGVGSRLPLATSATGRAYLAGCEEAERNTLLAQIKKSSSEDWFAISNGVEQALRDYHERGFCVSTKEWNKDISGVGVPFLAPNGTLMSFNCGGPAFLLPRRKLVEEIGPRLVELVNGVSALTGRQPIPSGRLPGITAKRMRT